MGVLRGQGEEEEEQVWAAPVEGGGGTAWVGVVRCQVEKEGQV